MTSERTVGSGVPALPWRCTAFGEHAFVTADPKGLARSVCDGFIDDMEWITELHNAVISDGWRARLARRVLRLHSVEEQ